MSGEDVDCPYKGKCRSFPWRCDSCRHNKGKRDYYDPDDWYKPLKPWIPPFPEDPYPIHPWKKYWIWCSR